ncbi:MAG: TonB-dependent receptor [Blastocatellia bacterium]|nr:TonB-dependent receptor [Blastocatellia bacterium]
MFKQSPVIRLTIIISLSLVGTARAQQFTGTIRGTIQDSAGAVIAGAEVSVVNKGTNETHNVATETNGAYVVPQLKPGLYRVTVKKSGFKTATLDEVKVDVQQIREVDLSLNVGETSETVTVTSSGAAAIEVSSTTVSQTIENKSIIDLPLNGRNPFSLATLAPGVIPAPGSSPFISGGRNATSEVTIDGISDVNAENNVSILDLNYTPSVDAVQEVSVQTNSVSAEFGRLGGGVINLVTKPGSNQFHWTAFEFMRNSFLDANNFFSNRAGIDKGSFKRNQFGGNVGGPMRKDRTFFFINYEGLRQGSADVGTFTVPSLQWRQGDFTGLKNAGGQLIQLYNPFSTREVSPGSGRYTRDPFMCDAGGNPLPLQPNKTQIGGTACNKIPQGLISPIARNLMQYWPLPNTTPINANTQQNNYTAVGTGVTNANQIDSRVDHNFSANFRTFVRYSTLFQNPSRPFNHYQNLATPNNAGPVDSTAKSLSVDNVYTVSPTLFLNARYGFNRRTAKRTPFSAGFDITQLGFPAAIKQVAQAGEFPRFDVSGFSSLGQETFNDLVIAPTTHSFNVNVTKTLPRHTFKLGMDYRKLMLNFLQLGQPSGQYSFQPTWTQRDPNQGSNTEGFALASLLIGVPNSGVISHDPTPASASSYWGWYFEDTWKMTSKLTVNLGLRYDIDVPRTERFNRLSVFDFDAPSPIAGQVPANPFFNPADLKGAIKFVTADHPRQVPADKNNFGPRIGFAYDVNEKTVVRAAYGIYYAPSALQAAGHTGSAGMIGYRTSSNMIVSTDGRVPSTFLDNPFPNGFNLPPGTTLGPATNIGLGIGEGVIPDYHSPYIQQWNLNVQREMPGNIVFEAAYLGSKGTRLLAGESGITQSQLDPSYLSLGAQLNAQVPNPFFGIITNPSSPLRSPTVSRNRLLRPYPQYDGINAFRVPYGFSIYHGGTLRADKRFSKGLSLLFAYTWSKLIDDVSTTVGFLGQSSARQNAYDRAAERAIGSQDIAHRFVGSFVYDLPFGKGKKFGSSMHSAAGWLAGGWQFNGIVTFQSGLPIIITQSQNNTGLFNPSQRPTWNGNDPNIGGSGSKEAKLAKWFDTSAFSITPPFTFGNTPRVMPNLRMDGDKNFDLSLFKNNNFKEGKWNAQFRLEAFNAFNRVRFSGPNGQVDSTNFGIVGSQGNNPRQIQLALKLIF